MVVALVAALVALTQNTGGLNLDVHGWIAGFLIAGFIATAAVALTTLWVKLIWPAIHGTVDFVDDLPGMREAGKNADELAELAKISTTLQDVAAQFKADGNGSLRTAVNEMRDAVDENTSLTREALATAKQALVAAQGANAAVLDLSARVAVLEPSRSS